MLVGGAQTDDLGDRRLWRADRQGARMPGAVARTRIVNQRRDQRQIGNVFAQGPVPQPLSLPVLAMAAPVQRGDRANDHYLGDDRAQAVEARRLVQSLTADASMEGLIKFNCDFGSPVLEAEAEIWSGDYAAAEAAAKYALAERSKYPTMGLDEAIHNKGNVALHFELAQALYVQSLTDPAKGPALRHEALGLMDQLPAEFRRLHDVIRWRQLMLSAH